MKKILFVLVLASQLAAFAQRSNCAAYPEQITLTQPNGQALKAYIKGNEMLFRYESLEGYTILQNPLNGGTYEYAMLNAEGDLIPGGIVAEQQMPEGFGKNMIAKELKFSAKQTKQAEAQFFANEKPFQLGKTANGSFPGKGNSKLLVVLMQFPDELATYNKQSFEDLMSQDGYSVNGGTGSFKQFFSQTSFGQLNIEVTVIGWFTARRNRIAYGRTDATGANNPSYMSNVRELVAQAVDSAEGAGINFKNYDNNNDGELDGLMIFHSGFGAEQGTNGYIWSHRSSVWGSNARTYDGVSITDYCINPAKRNFGGGTTQVRIGVATHEFGHILGLPDLYDTDQVSEGAGNWCLMAGGPWMNSERTPCQMNTWCKSELGWITPTVINTRGNYSLRHTQDSNFAYRINTPATNQYFLLENRQQKGWDRFLPGRGLIIWHINTTIADRYSNSGINDVNTDTSAYGVGVIQADGLRDLENNRDRGDAGDPYPGATNNRTFTPSSFPNSNLHLNTQGIRPPSNVFVTGITQRADSVIVFDIGAKSIADFTPSAVSGCAPLSVTFDNKSTFATSYLWRIDGAPQTTATNTSATFTQAGTYKATLFVYDTAAIADSFTTNILVYAPPKAGFNVARDGNRFTFTNTSTGASYYQWKFGPNITSSSVNPTVNATGTGSFEYTLIAWSSQNCSDTVRGSAPIYPTGVNEAPLSSNLKLSATPNPFTQSTTLNFELAMPSNVEVAIYNVLGAKVYSSKMEAQPSGAIKIDITSDMIKNEGVYIVRVLANGQEGQYKIVKQ